MEAVLVTETLVSVYHTARGYMQEVFCVNIPVLTTASMLIHTCRVPTVPALRESPRVAGRKRTWADRPQAVERRQLLINTYSTVPLPCCSVALRSRFQSDMVRARQGHDIVCVNQTQSRCVIQMGKT